MFSWVKYDNRRLVKNNYKRDEMGCSEGPNIEL